MDLLLFIVAAWLAADLVTGAVHWWEDRYGDPAWPILGPLVVSPNITHHRSPRAFLAGSMLERNWTAAAPALIAAGTFAWAGAWWLATVAAMAATANEIHAWSHQRCSRPIRGLQLLGVLCSQEDHARHHEEPFNRDFCVLSGWLNPLLSAVGFWWQLEFLIGLVTGVWPKREREIA